MIVTAIVDPTALDRKYWKGNKLYQDQIELFLRDIFINGLLISDGKGKLLRELAEKIKPIPRHRAITLFEEIKKTKRVVEYKYPIQYHETWKICCELERELEKLHHPPDVIITGEDHRRDINTSATQVITFTDYINSDFKKKRDDYLIEKPLHKLNLGERKDLFTRVIRFARKIRIYDKQIGKATSLSGFKRGISFILRLFKESDFHGNKTVEVEIYTFPHDHGYTTNPLDQETANNRIREFIGELREEFDLSLKLFVMNDNEEQHHARYLQTESAILLMERGFDFVDSKNDGTVKPTEISLKPRSRDYLREIRQLPNHCTLK